MKEKINYIQVILGVFSSIAVYLLAVMVNARHFNLFGITYSNYILSFGMFLFYIAYAIGIAIYGKKKNKADFYKAGIISLSIPVLSYIVFLIFATCISIIQNIVIIPDVFQPIITGVHYALEILGTASSAIIAGFGTDFMFFVGIVMMTLSFIVSGVVYKKIK